MMKSITDRQGDTEEATEQMHETHEAMLAAMETAVLICDSRGRIRDANASAAALLFQSGPGRRDWLPEVCRDRNKAERISSALARRMPFEEVVELHQNRSTRHVRLRGRWLDGQGREPRVIVEGTDITDLRMREKQLRMRLCRDELTGVASRRYFLDVGERALLDTRRYGRRLSVLMLDLDDFKKINDQHGHAVGDQFLCFVTEVCTRLLRRNDLLGRLGGDEFAALLPCTSLSRARSVANRLRKGLAEAIAGNPIGGSATTISIGIAGSEPTDRSIHELIARADAALYTAKRSGRDAIHCYETAA